MTSDPAKVPNHSWVPRKGVEARVRDLPPAGEAAARLFPEFEFGAPVSRCGDQILYTARIRANGAPCLMLWIEAPAFRDAGHLASFLAGMPAVQAMAHPRLLSLLWVGERAGNVCLGYEAFAGEMLFGVMDRYRLDPPTVVAITAALGDALQAAHPAGMMHRDLNPGWILVDGSGGIKVAGMGITPLLHGSDREFFGALLKRPGYLRSYLSPEQLHLEVPSDYRTDVYALGMITYELLVGNTPDGFVVLPSSRAHVGTHVDQVIFRALHSSREMRYQTTAEFARDVQLIYAAHSNRHFPDHPAQDGLPLPVPRRKKRRVVPWLAGVAGLLMLAAAGGWWYLRAFPGSGAAGVDPTAADTPLRSLAATLSQNKPGLGKEQREAILLVTNALLQNMIEAIRRSKNGEPGLVAAELLMQAGMEDLSLEWLRRLQAETPPDSPDWQRIEVIRQLMLAGRAGYQSATAAADFARKAGDQRGERRALAEAAGFIPRHLGMAEREQQNGYDPVPELEAVLKQMTGDRGGGPVRYAIRARGLELQLDLANNALLHDLSPLRDFPITQLDLSGTMVADLTPLSRMPLQALHADRCPLLSLSPVTRGPLGLLTAENCRIPDAGGLPESPMLTSYRITLEDGTLHTRTGPPHWGRPWVNSLGMRIQPSALRSPLLVAASETRVRDFREFASAARPPEGPVPAVPGSASPATKSTATGNPAPLQPLPTRLDFPIVGISWQEAQDFCTWLTARERAQGLLSTRSSYRLLTSREWNEAAGLFSLNQAGSTPLARHGPPFAYAGNLPPAWQLPSAAALAGLNGAPSLMPPAGTFRSQQGFCDLGNQVREWCQPPPAGNPKAPETPLVRDYAGRNSLSLTRSRGSVLTLAAMGTAPADSRQGDLGFRIVLELPPVHALSE